MGRQIHFNLARDLLDRQLKDVHGCPFGKVDGVVLELPRGKPPRVAQIEVGGVTAVKRLPGLLRKLTEPLVRRWSAKHGAPMLIEWAKIGHIGKDIDVDIDATDTQALYWHRRLQRLVSHIPGAK